MRISRRRFLRWTLVGIGAVGTGGVGGPVYAALIEPRWLALERVAIDLPGLSARLDGLRIGLLSDLHRGVHVPQEWVGRAVGMLRSESPDLILLTGDYVTGSADFAVSCAEELGRLSAPHGVYACLGNHDHWTDAERVTDTLEGAGVRVLRNRATEPVDGLWVAGVDDVWEQKADLQAALAEVPSSATVILLAHEPDFADEVVADGRVALQLSGHTHGGQVRLPIIGPPFLPYLGRKYPIGLYRIGPMWLYVSRGVGLIAPPVRFLCRPEVTVLELRSAPL
ncbi:MAG TPA: metallophosphoesterase [Chloroflexi bacterium]|nr:metallophosphoesterase [Chloroflexota bacterium]